MYSSHRHRERETSYPVGVSGFYRTVQRNWGNSHFLKQISRIEWVNDHPVGVGGFL